MDKKIITELKKKLEQEKVLLKEDLLKFADKDKKLPDDYDTRFPNLGERSSAPDENAEEVETYENLLAIEYALESRLKEVNEALEKINNNNYGHCDICKKNIETDRLKANPAAKLCFSCAKKEE
ncbi:MAG: TraR/DksA C4-type zinc finger protein [Candidatus Pacebacteria bacterium]|jgi:DnaK suppressor protein|nr:TraR/DksA C4-type zinc finger protein [Candidatus Paceibacterota bacterium]MDD4994739.1 TraR/DksA C4-type zinc finger protein [Candidatus Paceibacterota bacterium]MDD5535377.1 TraR/DksA C4-type zinc finger protein [Candidatus Paceibacterota bacterium]